MAELLPAALGWIDEKKRQALRTVTQAIAEAQANPVESIVNALRGTARGALQLGDLAATPFNLGQSGGVADKILPSGGSAAESIGEFLGPPLKMGAKVAGMAMAGAIPLMKKLKDIEVEGHLFPLTPEGGTPLFLTKQGDKIGDAASGMDSHGTLLNNAGVNNDPMSADALGLHYVDSGNPAQHSIIATPNTKYSDAAGVAEQYADETGLNVKLHHGGKQYFFGPGEVKTPPFQGTEELPSIDPSMLHEPQLTPVPLNQRPVAPETMQMLAAHGLDATNLEKIQKFTGEQPEQILQRFEMAQKNAAEMGLPPGNTSRDRALSAGYPDIGDRDNYLWRGVSTPRPVIKTPVEAGVPSANSPRQMDAVFASEPEGRAYRGFGQIHYPVVSTDPVAAMFDPANEAHQAAFIKRFDELHPEGDMGFKGQELVDSWKQNYNGPRAAWDEMETVPGVTRTLKDLGFPGFRTEESGPNRAVFNPWDWRHPLAAFDPAEANTRNLFASAGGVTALAALLAQQNLPIDAPAQ